MLGTPSDRVLRVMTDDGGFRVIAARTLDTVRAAVAAQEATGETARAFGELLTGAILYRETMAPTLRVQAILQGVGGAGQLVADSSPGGGTRGLVRLPEGAGGLQLRGGALLQMMRDMPRGEPHRGVVEVPESGRISDALMAYMHSSEQVVSMISVGCRSEAGRVTVAGGYIVQLLPELDAGLLAIMTERLASFEGVDTLLSEVASSPERLTDELLHGMPYTRLDESPLRFECGCDRVRVMTSLATLGPEDIEELMRDGSPIELTCDYCGAGYEVASEQLRGMLDAT